MLGMQCMIKGNVYLEKIVFAPILMKNMIMKAMMITVRMIMKQNSVKMLMMKSQQTPVQVVMRFLGTTKRLDKP